MRYLRALLALVIGVAPIVPGTASAAAATYHVVRPGQTLRAIAALYRLRPIDLAVWNGIVSPYPVYPDEVLRLDRPAVPLPVFRTKVQAATAAMVDWQPANGCPVPPADLRKIWVSYIDANGDYHAGSIIMHRLLVARTQAVFRGLYYRRFRIQAMSPMSVNMPGATDFSVMTSGYSCRNVAGSTTLSQHAYGRAIDVNPLQNPEVRDGSIDPPGGVAYLKRSSYRRGMVHGDGAAAIFTAYGFGWGGRWNSLKDYMHFSTTNR